MLFYQNENRRLEMREIRSPLEELEASEAEFIMPPPQAALRLDYPYSAYGVPLHGETLPTVSPALSVVPEGDEQEEGEMKQLEGGGEPEEQMELKYEEPNVGEVSSCSSCRF